MEEKYKLKVQILGPDKDGVQEIRVLNNIIRWAPEGIELEAAPRHAEIVIKELGLQGAKAMGVSLPNTATTQELFNSCSANGGAKSDHSAMVKALERMANHEVAK